MNFDTLYTGSLVRLAARINPEFAEAMARWTHDAEYMRLIDSDPAQMVSAAQVEAHIQKEKNKESRFEFALRTIDGDKLIGEGGLNVKWNHQHTWLGIGIGEPDYRNRGYGTDAVKLLTSYAFRELGMHRVQLGVFSNNPRAIRAYEKAGFIREVVHRGTIHRDGQRYDDHMMSILRPEWEAMQERALT